MTPRKWLESNGHNPVPGSEPDRFAHVYRDEWRQVLRQDPCAYCGRPAGTIDHITAKSRGKHPRGCWLDYTGACLACNAAKGQRTLLAFLLGVAGLESDLREHDRWRSRQQRVRLGRAEAA